MAQFGFYYDNSRCTGCKTCVMACKDYYDSDLKTAYRKVYDVEGGGFQQQEDGTYKTDAFLYHISYSCGHCAEPVCVQYCPTTAMHKDDSDGIVKVDVSKCIGCGYCVMVCPYNAPRVDKNLGHAVKCEGCYERLDEGLAPVCVSSCPLRALDYGDIADLRAKYGEDAQIFPMPDPSVTQPNVCIKPSEASKAANKANSSVSNPEEVQ